MICVYTNLLYLVICLAMPHVTHPDTTASHFQVRGLTEAAGKYETLNRILDYDMKNDTVKSPGSLSRNLRRVRQGLDLIRALFLNFLSSGYVSSISGFLLFDVKIFYHETLTF